MKYRARIIGDPEIALNEDKMHPVIHRVMIASEKNCNVRKMKSHTLMLKSHTMTQPVRPDRDHLRKVLSFSSVVVGSVHGALLNRLNTK